MATTKKQPTKKQPTKKNQLKKLITEWKATTQQDEQRYHLKHS